MNITMEMGMGRRAGCWGCCFLCFRAFCLAGYFFGFLAALRGGSLFFGVVGLALQRLFLAVVLSGCS
jgi:hypothetical protein